ncbi:MAG: WecB/TagA/CpsF family glycosyltransferase [Bacteroidales bacterium]|nr:WecB/TagA/CpsF family glycosyltransferase [Bacteroidales bacterium]
MSNTFTSFFGQKLFAGTTGEATDYFDRLIATKHPKLIGAINVYLLTTCYRDRQMSDLYNKFDLVTVDGRPLVYLSHIFASVPVKEMVGGPNFWETIIRFGAEHGHNFYFLGSFPNILTKAAAKLKDRYPGLDVTGMHHGIVEDEEQFTIEVLKEIKEKKPAIIMIGMPSPIKEKLATLFREELECGMIIIIGGAFDIFAGEKKLAPHLISILCLEWFYRMIQEPGRLFWRYMASNLYFLYMLTTNIRIPLQKLIRKFT